MSVEVASRNSSAPPGVIQVRQPALGWPTSAHEILQWDGIVVSGHVRRNVSRITIGSQTAYLKREHHIGWKVRWNNFRQGFGWVSLSEREARVLIALEKHGLGCPVWRAFGEAQGQGFLLLEECPHQPINDFPVTAIADYIHRLHAAGVWQPDLFFKHLRRHPQSGEILMLDWQRACLTRQVTIRQQTAALAMLLATTPDQVLDPSGRQSFLRLFPDLSSQRVQALARAYRQRPAIQKQLAPQLSEVQQLLVRIQGETVCAIPELADQFRSPCAIDELYRQRTQDVPFGAQAILRSRRYRPGLRRWWSQVRGKAWRTPELKQARLLFHLERHGLPGPRMLAYGQRDNGLSSFLIFEPRRQGLSAWEFLDRLHRAMVCLIDPQLSFVMQGEQLVLVDPRGLQLVKRISASQRAADRQRLECFLRGAS